MEAPAYYRRSMSDGAIAGQLAAFVKHQRILQNKTQQELATEAGVTRRTLSAYELGKYNINVMTLIQLLRALDALYVFDSFQIVHDESPLMLAEREEKFRKRASRKKDQPSPPKSDW